MESCAERRWRRVESARSSQIARKIAAAAKIPRQMARSVDVVSSRAGTVIGAQHESHKALNQIQAERRGILVDD